MIYRDFQDKKLSLLGLGAMRLPVLPDSNGKIDEAQVEEMVRIAMENGVQTDLRAGKFLRKAY